MIKLHNPATLGTLTLLALVCTLLAACGGGGEDEDTRRDHLPIDCKARPELCR